MLEIDSRLLMNTLLVVMLTQCLLFYNDYLYMFGFSSYEYSSFVIHRTIIRIEYIFLSFFNYYQ